MIEVKCEFGDAAYMQQKIEDMLNSGWEILFTHAISSNQSINRGYETIVYFKRNKQS